MVSLFLIAALLAASPASTPRAEMRVDSAVRPLKNFRVVFPDTKEGKRAQAGYKAHAAKGEIPGLTFGGGYAVGRIADGIAVETKLSGDEILPARVPATLSGNQLVLYYESCRRPYRLSPNASSMRYPQRGLRVWNSQIRLSVVQWLIYGIPDENYQVSFQGTDIGTYPEKE
ncbi:MAG: hypothetical protein JSS21_04575, partial [Proteobacteria bacterium]|nr:hypothetical protein [Pseudomonadota bacterium]